MVKEIKISINFIMTSEDLHAINMTFTIGEGAIAGDSTVVNGLRHIWRRRWSKPT